MKKKLDLLNYNNSDHFDCGLVSVIMPCYNSSETIKSSIQSILDQTYSNLELIIIDDYSKDESTEIVETYLEDKRVKLIRNQNNLGVAETRNRGIENAQGKYIAFCDSDDVWLKDKLTKQVHYLQRYDIVCSNYILSNIEKKRTKNIKGPEFITYHQMLKSNFIPNSSAIYNCSALGKIYQKKVRHEDYLMWLELMKKTNIVYRIQEPLMQYNQVQQSLSGNKLHSLIWTYKILHRELKLNNLLVIRNLILNIFINIRKHFL